MLEMVVMMRDGRESAILLGVNSVGRELMVLDLTEVEPGFPRIGTCRGGVDNHRGTSRTVMLIHGLLTWRIIGRLGTRIQ